MYAFPESNYLPAPEHAEAYAARLDAGRRVATASRVAICGLARQLGPTLERLTIPAIDALGGLFAEYRVFVFENDSTDGTDGRLKAWAARDRRVHVTCARLRQPHWPAVRNPRRADAMARYRNRYLGAVDASPARDFEYSLVLDADIGRYSLDGVLDALGREEAWDAQCANGLAIYRGRPIQYDAWAWREPGSREPLPHTAVNPIVLRRGEPLRRVLSAFGGMAIYKMPSFLASRYEGGDCEHVAFHAGMKDVFVNGSMVVDYGDLQR